MPASPLYKITFAGGQTIDLPGSRRCYRQSVQGVRSGLCIRDVQPGDVIGIGPSMVLRRVESIERLAPRTRRKQ